MILIESNILSVYDRRRCHHLVCAGRPDISASGPSPLPSPAPWILRSAWTVLAGIFSSRGVRRFAGLRPPELRAPDPGAAGAGGPVHSYRRTTIRRCIDLS